MNPNFYKGTIVEGAVAKLLGTGTAGTGSRSDAATVTSNALR
jgi:hypothetical protein